ncbi:cytochrome b5 reductase 4-like protein [Sarcoptes scabiei]|uniref:Cytochrome b5 reductase 4-like protein n=1 Tax=Sarcoptes scabiei TaxID=52283 RepID=A0A132ALE2_SARSC|nr:cytochrome b5 reductase 4-like protein [Sarcoptes scabiei]
MNDSNTEKSNQSKSTSTTGNATGSQRTKVALKPGFGLMGWIRFSSSAKNLSGIDNENDEKRFITLNELSKHDKPDDCWIAIRGKVFNITSYLEYHPGGVEELMKGAGQNATNMFEDVHAWVNYESLLQKCYIGRLSGFDL